MDNSRRSDKPKFKNAICLFCSQEFAAKRYFTERNGKYYSSYCSKLCDFSDRVGRNVVEKEEWKCATCNLIRHLTPYYAKSRNYCSKKCSAAKPNQGRFKEKYEGIPCGTCGTSIRPWHKYCSKKCYGTANSGENNPKWIDGRTPENKRVRGLMEYKQWARAVKERDSFTCQACGQVGGVLHSDHIKPFAQFTELRFDLNNGRTLCIDCHKLTPTYLTTRKYVEAS